MNKRPEEALAGMIANLKEKTGKSLDEWAGIIAKAKLAKHGDIMKFLKGEHGVSHGYANQIALNVLKAPTTSNADPVEEMYSGKKAPLKPIHDALLKKISAFGPDVDLAPKKGYVSVRRSKQFAIIQPSTADRLDLGIQLKGKKPTDRLEPSGSFNAMLSHRVRLSSVKDVDAELIAWLKEAYSSA